MLVSPRGQFFCPSLPARHSFRSGNAGGSPDGQNETVSLRPLSLVYLCQELFLMLFHEAGKNTFKIALVTENVTLSNPGL